MMPLSPRVIQMLMIAITLTCLQSPFAAFAGGVDGGGNGVFIAKPDSQHLVFWDLYLSAPRFNDQRSGDAMVFRAPQASPVFGEMIDYRDFKSFRYLKGRLKLWSKRARNLVKLVGRDGFISQGERDSFRLLLVGTPLYVQVLNEVSVPPSMNTKGITAIPGATYDEDSAKVFVNQETWNRAGLVSQAAMLLHERLRSFQVHYVLPNSELQRLVAMIMLRDPKSVSGKEYDDSAYTLSSLSTRPTTGGLLSGFGHALSLYYTARHLDSIFACLKLSVAKTCLRNYYASLPKDPKATPFPEDAPLYYFVNENFYVERAAKAKLLGPNPGSFKLESTGKRNQPAPQFPSDAIFTRMYGVYTIKKCSGHTSSKENHYRFCGYKELRLLPSSSDPLRASIYINGLLSADGQRVTSFGFMNAARADEGAVYQEEDDSSARYRLASADSSRLQEYSISRVGTTNTYILKATETSKGSSSNFSFKFILEKQ